MQNDDGWILIEVPLFERMDRFCPGMFTLEHLNYFSEKTLFETITKSGYDIAFSTKYFDHDEYPVITVIARKNANVRIFKSDDYKRANALAINYIEQEKESWKIIEQKIKYIVKEGSSIYIYGAGIHTTQLLAFTDLTEYINILGLLDSSSTKWGKRIGRLTCFNRNEIEFKEGDTIIISSFASEDEIYKGLSPLLMNGINVLKLYDYNEEIISL